MSLLTRHIEAGWHEVSQYGKFAAEKFLSLSGATASTLREEADSFRDLVAKLDQRENALGGDPSQPVKSVTYSDGRTLTDAEHSANVILDIQPKPQDPVPGFVGAPSIAQQHLDAALSPEDQATVDAEREAEAVQLSSVGATLLDPAQLEPDNTVVEPDAVLSDDARAAAKATEDALEAGDYSGPSEAPETEQASSEDSGEATSESEPLSSSVETVASTPDNHSPAQGNSEGTVNTPPAAA